MKLSTYLKDLAFFVATPSFAVPSYAQPPLQGRGAQ